MNRPLALFALASVTLSAAAVRPHQVPQPASPNLRTSIDSFVDRQVAADAFAGVVALARNGGVIDQRAVGVANRETGAAMALDTNSHFRANGGGPGVNAEFSIYPTGDVLIVLSSYDPPSGTAAAQFIRSLLQPAAMPNPLKAEIDSLHVAMVAAFKRSPASVAQFYTDDAKIIGMGMRKSGRAEVEAYWSQSMGTTDWTLETFEVGGTRDEPWLLGKSTLVGSGGRRMETDYLAVLQRGADGKLRYRIDLFTSSNRPMLRAP